MPSADMREEVESEGGEGDEKGITELATLFNQSAFVRRLARSPPDSLAYFCLAWSFDAF